MKEIDLNNYEYKLPFILLDDLVAFPGASLDFDVIGPENKKSLKLAEQTDSTIFIATKKGETTDNNIQVNSTGVVARVIQRLHSTNSADRVFVQCFQKAKLGSLFRHNDNKAEAMCVEIEDFVNKESDELTPENIEARMRLVKQEFEEWGNYSGVAADSFNNIEKITDPNDFIAEIVYCGAFSTEQKQELLNAGNEIELLDLAYKFLTNETEIEKIQRSLTNQASLNVDRERQQQILQEQMNILSNQLGLGGEGMGEDGDDINWEAKIKRYIKDPASKKSLMREANHLSKLPPMSQEAYVIRNYLEAVFSLPWGKSSHVETDLAKSQEILDADHYGMKKVKERIVESLAADDMADTGNTNIICLVGPPGTGKTSVARSIARATGRKYVRVSLGGVRDEAEIRGHRKTYLGAMPGRIVNALVQAGTDNPVMLLDEIDKLGADYKGDPASALLEVLDSEQNKAFVDHYIEVPFDLSNVMFIATANDLSTVPAPLLDRMEIIELSSYTREEKFEIAKRYLIPKQRKKHGLKATQFKISDPALYNIIDNYTREAGVRQLERLIASLCRKADKRIVLEEGKSLNITPKKIEEYLGPVKYQPDEQSRTDTVGMVNGLAWTSVGGVLLPVEAITVKGKGRIQLTGSLGDVMQESAKIAISYARTKAEKYGYAEDFIENTDIHIHAPEGATPKDGPSAGVTMATAVISALSGRKVKSDVAMTGEITLHGNVIPIGGLREKTMAAYRAGMKTCIIPERNKPDMEEVDDKVKENVNFIFAKTLDDVLDNALV